MRVDREKAVQAAQKFVSKGRPDKAIIEYQKLVKANPSDDRALLKIAELQTRMRSYEAAVSTYEEVARYYVGQGFSARAMAIYKQIRGLIQQHLPGSKGHYGPVVDKLANLYLEAGLKGDAVATYQEYTQHLTRAGREDELLPVFRKIFELKPDDLDTRLRLIELLRGQGDHDEADEHLVVYGERLIELGRVDEGVHALDNVAQRKLEDAKLARRVAELLLDRNGPNDAMTALTRMQACFLTTKRDIETLRVLARALSTIGQRPKAVEVRKLMVKIALDNGDTAIAEKLVTELLQEFPRDTVIRDLALAIIPGMVGPRSVPMPKDDGPVVEAEPATVDISEGSFELIDESFVELGEDALEGYSSRPAPPPEPYIPQSVPVVAPALDPGAGAHLPPPPRPASLRFAPPPVAPRPSTHGAPLSPLPISPALDDLDGPSDLDADYDSLMPEAEPEPATQSRTTDDLFGLDEDNTTNVLKSDIPHGCSGSLGTDPDDLGARFGVPGTGGLETAELNGYAISDLPPPISQPIRPAMPTHPEYEVDEALEEAFEEADFFASQDLFEDALSALEELIPRYPGHPLLIERMQSVRAAMRKRDGD